MSKTLSNQDLDIDLPDALPETVDVVNTFVRGWTVRGSWNSKVDNKIHGRFELRQNVKNLNEFEIQLIYDKKSSYTPGSSRLWMLEGIVHDKDSVAARSKNFASGQSIMLELHRANECVWVGNLTSIYPADLVGITGIALSD